MSTEARDEAWELYRSVPVNPGKFTVQQSEQDGFNAGWNAALSSPPVTVSDEELLTAYRGDNQHGHLVNSGHLARLRRVAALSSPAAVSEEPEYHECQACYQSVDDHKPGCPAALSAPKGTTPI